MEEQITNLFGLMPHFYTRFNKSHFAGLAAKIAARKLPFFFAFLLSSLSLSLLCFLTHIFLFFHKIWNCFLEVTLKSSKMEVNMQEKIESEHAKKILMTVIFKTISSAYFLALNKNDSVLSYFFSFSFIFHLLFLSLS